MKEIREKTGLKILKQKQRGRGTKGAKLIVDGVEKKEKERESGRERVREREREKGGTCCRPHLLNSIGCKPRESPPALHRSTHSMSKSSDSDLFSSCGPYHHVKVK